MSEKRLEIGWKTGLSCFKWDAAGLGDVSFYYMNRQADPWYSDSEEEVQLSKEKAIEIIAFLKEAFDI